MAYEVVVVGAGIGGLTAGALLAARGASVCVLERESRGGGCATLFEKFGYGFETTAGLYAGWQPGGVHARVFDELHVAPPEARRLAPAYAVRLPDGADVRVGASAAEDAGGTRGAGASPSGAAEEFESVLRAAFPECAGAAVEFYRALAPLADALGRVLRRVPSPAQATRFERLKLTAAEPRATRLLLSARAETLAPLLAPTSARFRRFVDAQLEVFGQAAGDACSLAYAAAALTLPSRGLFALRGGAAALADSLADSIRRSGGTVRFDAPVLRLAYDAAGRAVGVDLLSGETVRATRAVVSNLTAWDTYGKLVGQGRTPADVRARLKTLRARSAYLIFLGAEEETFARLPATHLIAAGDGGTDAPLVFGAAPAWDARAPAGRRAVTVSTYAEPEDWFTFHEDESEHEERDQRTLEAVWSRLHAALPELGAGVEVIETLTPRDFYERTRRRLGAVCGTPRTPEAFGPAGFTHRTSLPNLYMVGDTTFHGSGLAAVTHSALAAANEIAPPRN
jgi:phytoene dehydrogenase-like protein